MRLTKKYVTFLLAAAAVLATACQNEVSEMSLSNTSNRKIEVKPCTSGTQTFTRAQGKPTTPNAEPIIGTSMPFDRNLMMSAYFNPSTDGARGVLAENGCNYFTGLKFSYNVASKAWMVEEDQVFWPLTGSLDFLAYSAEQENLTATWADVENYDDNVSKKLVLTNFDENMSHVDDVLYGTAKNQSSTNTAVPIEFRHAKAFIVFTAKANYDGAIKITDISFQNFQKVTSASTLTVDNSGDEPVATWTINGGHGSGLGPFDVPGLQNGTNPYLVPRKPIDVNNKANYGGIGGGVMVYGGQQMKPFTVTFTQTAPNGHTVSETFTYDPKIGLNEEDQIWKAGKRYIYEFDFDLHEIKVTSTVRDWDNESTVIDIPEVATMEVDCPSGVLTQTIPNVTINPQTKLVVDWGDGYYDIHENNDRGSIQDNLQHTFASIGGIHVVKFYVSEGGCVEINDPPFPCQVYDSERFKVTYTITFANGQPGSFDPVNMPGPMNVPIGSKVPKPSPDPSAPSGTEGSWTFTGWYKDEECTHEFDFDNTYVTSPLTLYSKFIVSLSPPTPVTPTPIE